MCVRGVVACQISECLRKMRVNFNEVALSAASPLLAYSPPLVMREDMIEECSCNTCFAHSPLCTHFCCGFGKGFLGGKFSCMLLHYAARTRDDANGERRVAKERVDVRCQLFVFLA